MTHPAPAPMGRRMLAFLVDQAAAMAFGGGLLLGAVLPGVLASRTGATPGVGTPAPTPAPIVLLLSWGLLGTFAMFQWWAQGVHGWTIGKLLLGLRTVDVRNGRPIGMGRVLVRGLVVGAGWLAFGVGQLVVVASPLWDRTGRNRGWHDRSAGDEVVDLRTGALPSPRPRARRSLAEPTSRRTPAAGAGTATVTVVPTWVTARDLDEAARAANNAAQEVATQAPDDLWSKVLPAGYDAARPEATRRIVRADREARADAAHAAAARRLGALLSDRRADVPSLVLPPFAEPGVAPDVDTRALAVLGPTSVRPGPSPGLDPGLEQTRHAPLRPDERPPTPGADPTTADLELSDGRVVTVVRSLLVGRNPSADDGSQLVRVADPGRSVSKTHLQVGLDRTGLWVADRGSTNGTLVTLGDGSQIVCGPGQQVRLPVGATVSFGDCGLRVVRAPDATSRS